jgi:hypothetical protein
VPRWSTGFGVTLGRVWGRRTTLAPTVPTPEIYVSLLNEGVDVWRPVRAEYVQGSVYRIVDQPYDRETETWQFEPGDEVVCELIDASEGRLLAAVSEHHATPGHVFGVMRIGSVDVDPDDRLTLTGVFATFEAAENDAARLNAIARERGSSATYVALESRLKEHPDDGDGPQPRGSGRR